LKAYALRLRPGEDPKAALDTFAQTHQLEAACVLTCIGSLCKAEKEGGLSVVGPHR
jgi:hypothetical protein